MPLGEDRRHGPDCRDRGQCRRDHGDAGSETENGEGRKDQQHRLHDAWRPDAGGGHGEAPT
jgi:hypothetical protein